MLDGLNECRDYKQKSTTIERGTYNSVGGADKIGRDVRVVSGLDGLPKAREEFRDDTENNRFRRC